MFPYTLDPIPHEYRRHVAGGVGSGASRGERKARGSFYTPKDVAFHIVDMALDRIDMEQADLRVLDPAVGTGVFFRATLARLIRRGMPGQTAVSGLFGIDIDECSVDMATFVLLVDLAHESENGLPGRVKDWWEMLRGQFLAADTLSILNGVGDSDALFPSTIFPVFSSGGPAQHPDVQLGPYDLIIGNPPYAQLGERADIANLAARYRTLQSASKATAVWPAFTELLCSQLQPDGVGAMVVPLSVGCTTGGPGRRLRETATAAGGDWTFEFFDRTPDALFGDDIKQRTAVIVRKATAGLRLKTSPVMRWSSCNRPSLFSRIPQIDLRDYPFTTGVPKLGSDSEASVYISIRQQGASLRSAVLGVTRVVPSETTRDTCSVYVAATAYNWLSVYRYGGATVACADNPSTSPLTKLSVDSETRAYALYAALTSRLVFWLWRVEGDAFHVTQNWLLNLPLGLQDIDRATNERLATLGRRLWSTARDHPVLSNNSGKTTVSYCPYVEPDILNTIDRVLLNATGQPLNFCNELVAIVQQTVEAGRPEDQVHSLRRAFTSWEKKESNHSEGH